MTTPALARILVLILVAATFGAHRSSACSCTVEAGAAGTCGDLKVTGPSFVGTVIEIENPADERRGADQTGLSRYRFRVDENISGFEEKEVDIYSGRGGADCSYHFQKGQSYFVVPYKVTSSSAHQAKPGQLMVNICMGTEPAASAGDLLAELRARKRGSIVEGILRTKEQPNDYNHEMPDVLVELWGERTTFSAKTDKAGLFRFSGIPAGTYLFAAELPPNFQLAEKRPGDKPPAITITENRCYAKDIYAVPLAQSNGQTSDPK